MKKLNLKAVGKYFLYMLLVAFFVGCEDGTSGNSTKRANKDYSDIVVTEIDGCEYIVYRGVEKGGIIHKSNCKNSNHNCN